MRKDKLIIGIGKTTHLLYVGVNNGTIKINYHDSVDCRKCISTGIDDEYKLINLIRSKYQTRIERSSKLRVSEAIVVFPPEFYKESYLPVNKQRNNDLNMYFKKTYFKEGAVDLNSEWPDWIKIGNITAQGPTGLSAVNSLCLVSKLDKLKVESFLTKLCGTKMPIKAVMSPALGFGDLTAVLSKPSDSSGKMSIYVGREKTMMCAARNNNPCVYREVQLGFDSLVSDLRSKFGNLSEREVEWLLRTLGVSSVIERGKGQKLSREIEDSEPLMRSSSDVEADEFRISEDEEEAYAMNHPGEVGNASMVEDAELVKGANDAKSKGRAAESAMQEMDTRVDELGLTLIDDDELLLNMSMSDDKDEAFEFRMGEEDEEAEESGAFLGEMSGGVFEEGTLREGTLREGNSEELDLSEMNLDDVFGFMDEEGEEPKKQEVLQKPKEPQKAKKLPSASISAKDCNLDRHSRMDEASTNLLKKLESIEIKENPNWEEEMESLENSELNEVEDTQNALDEGKKLRGKAKRRASKNAKGGVKGTGGLFNKFRKDETVEFDLSNEGVSEGEAYESDEDLFEIFGSGEELLARKKISLSKYDEVVRGFVNLIKEQAERFITYCYGNQNMDMDKIYVASGNIEKLDTYLSKALSLAAIKLQLHKGETILSESVMISSICDDLPEEAYLYVGCAASNSVKRGKK